ncbi:MAG: hypothetical protein IJV82_02205 [Oscillospiraceae bacterium]|nr:hypothetical protein [Oscillospiraceae bacterium]
MSKRRFILQYVDHMYFKVVGAALTVALFALVYYYLRFPANLGLNDLVGMVFPGVMVLIWESLKKRNFWWVWLMGCCPCLLGAQLFASLENLLLHGYWLISLGVSVALAVVPSRSAVRFRERTRDDGSGDAPKAKKDEFLEKLFADQ